MNVLEVSLYDEVDTVDLPNLDCDLRDSEEGLLLENGVTLEGRTLSTDLVCSLLADFDCPETKPTKRFYRKH